MNNNVSSIMLSVGKLLLVGREDVVFRIEEGKENKIIELKRERIFRIPAYQRQIRWKAKNVNRLLNDIKMGDKFLGNILLSTKENQIYDVIDGQQRMTVLILIFKYLIKKTQDNSREVCGYQNDTYINFYRALDYGFDKEQILLLDYGKEVLATDILEQNDDFRTIWNEIDKLIKNLRPREINGLFENLCNCKLNVILNQEEDTGYDKDFLVNFYLDINDTAVKLDSVDILKGYLFKYSYQVMTEKWADNQRAIKHLRESGVCYSVETFYYHYILCTVNQQLGYKLTKLSPSLQIPKNIEGIRKGTHIIEAIPQFGFYVDMMDSIMSACKYMENIVNTSEYNEIFKKHYKLDNGGYESDISLKLFYSMQRAILLNADVVPKILLLKYYLEVLKKEYCKSNQYKMIYYIYICSIMFSATEQRKKIDKFMSIVLSKNFESELEKSAKKYITEGFGEKTYSRIVKNMLGKITEESGQYLPKDIYAIRSYFRVVNGSIKIEKERLFLFMRDINCSVEHYICPQSKSMKIEYGSEKKDENGKVKRLTTTLEVPKNVKKLLSVPGNYLILNREVNKEIGNLWIMDKISKIESKQNDAFNNSVVYEFFKKSKEIFWNQETFEKLKMTEDENDAKCIVSDFYKEEFEKKFQQYINAISQIGA